MTDDDVFLLSDEDAASPEVAASLTPPPSHDTESSFELLEEAAPIPSEPTPDDPVTHSFDAAALAQLASELEPIPEPEPAEPDTAILDPVARRRADIDAKQAIVSRILGEMGCEAVVFLMPAHVAWFTGGMTVRGLIADGERPGIYTNGSQRWLICGNVDSQRLFDEDLDGLGFMLKEWQWGIGRAILLGDLLAGKKVACDRPFPNMPLINDKLRRELRPLLTGDRERYQSLGRSVAHALEATARALRPGDSEHEAAGQLAHRLYHRGVEVTAMSIAADARAGRFRRAGFTEVAIERLCNMQVTATRDGLYASASRTVCFGPLTPPERSEYDACVRLSAVYRSLSVPNATLTTVATAANRLTTDTPYEHEWRLSQPGYAAGWFAADELRKAGIDEKFVLHQPLIWQTRLGGMAITDTFLVSDAGAVAMTPPDAWPYKLVRLNGQDHVVPDVLIRIV